MASSELTLPVPPDVARQVRDQGDRPKSAIAAISSQQGAMNPATAQNLATNMEAFEKLVGQMAEQIQVVAPQLMPLFEPIATAGKALKSEIAGMQGGKGGASQTPGAAPGVTTPEQNSESPGSVVGAG
jgi:hypothetical protein